MPNYTFELRDGSGGIDDETGVALTDSADALHYAQTIVHELMRSREAQTRTWRLDVYDGAGACVIELPFASVDRLSIICARSCGLWWKNSAIAAAPSTSWFTSPATP